MSQHSVTSGFSPEVLIDEVHGNLEVKGWDRPDILMKSSADDTPAPEVQEDTVRIGSKGNCLIRLPQRANVRVGNVHGNARIKFLDYQLKCNQVSGSLVLRNVGETHVETVHGDLLAKQMLGDLHVETIHGNAVARDIQGKCMLEKVGGNLELRDGESDIAVSATGNARVRLSLVAGENYHIEAGGNLHCRIPDTSNLQIDLSSSAKEIQVKLTGKKNVYREENFRFTLGDGDVSMKLSAGGSLSFVGQESLPFEMDDVQTEFEDAFAGFSEEFSQQIAEQIETQIDTQLEVLNDQMENLSTVIEQAGLSQKEIDRIMQRARESSDRATARSQEKMRRAQEKLERKLAAAQRKAELRAKAAERRRHSERSFKWPPPEEASPRETVSDEERLLILRMLEEKKISLEEAERLLSALEGN